MSDQARPSGWEQIPRYDLMTNYRWGTSVEEMERADDGEWVRWEDVQRLAPLAVEEVRRLREEADIDSDNVAALSAQVEQLRQEKETLKSNARIAINKGEELIGFLRSEKQELTVERDALRQQVKQLQKDQQDWRKGVALIASSLGDPADNLSCVRIAEIALEQRAQVEQLRKVLIESNAVCACGCDASEHESYGEDGESCSHEDHDCFRVSQSALAYLTALRQQVESLKEALADLLSDSDRWLAEGQIAAVKGTRTYMAREQARAALSTPSQTE